MKKSLIILAILATALSCAKEASVKDSAEKTSNANLQEMSFTASFEADTKAVLNNDRSVSFAAGDKVALFANGNKYEFTTAEGGANAVFTGTGEAADTYYAIYPYTDGVAFSAGTITGATISQSSAGTGTGTFNSQKAVAVAISSTTTMVFKQVTALLKITVPAEVDDLSEVIVFNRDDSGSNTAGAIAGTFNVTPVLNDDPTIEVTEAKFQAGFVGPNGSANPVPEGDYYIPVLPAQLTAKKGIDLKLTYLDSFIGRAFNGNGIKLERCKVYALGTVKKTNEYVFDNYESGAAIVSDDYTGNTGALAVIENPVKTAANGSNYVLKNDMSGSANNTSGYIQIKTGSDNGYIKFPSGVRGNFDKVRVKMYLGTNEYYPRARRGSNTAHLPAKLNGVAIDEGDITTWNGAVKTDDWNILEWNASQIDGGWSSFSSLATLELRPFVNWGGGNTEGFEETTNNRLIYVDDITFVLK